MIFPFTEEIKKQVKCKVLTDRDKECTEKELGDIKNQRDIQNLLQLTIYYAPVKYFDRLSRCGDKCNSEKNISILCLLNDDEFATKLNEDEFFTRLCALAFIQ